MTEVHPSMGDLPTFIPRQAGRASHKRNKSSLLVCTLIIGLVVVLTSSASTVAQVPETEPPTFSLLEVLQQSGRKAFRSGWAGFFAGAAQVVAFMWLRTTMNYQYVHGGGFFETLKKLHEEGGIRRFYKGLWPWAIFQAPISRFGATAANQLVLAIAAVYLPNVPLAIITMLASCAGACWRIFVLPIDAVKTALQVKGVEGYEELKEKMKKAGPMCLYAGWQAMWIADWLGNYPWFVTNNLLSNNLPVGSTVLIRILRNAFIGVAASCASDTTSNSMRVIKTYKQTASDHSMSYISCVNAIISQDGVYGLFFRGLGTRLFTNCLQGAAFSVMWKYFQGE